MRIAPGLFRVAMLCLSGLLLLVSHGPVWGQEREPRGGHRECPCRVCREKREGKKKEKQHNPLDLYRGGARVVTAWQARREQELPVADAMGFRSLARGKQDPEAKADAEAEAQLQPEMPDVPGGESKIDQAAEAARKRREARAAKQQPEPPRTSPSVLQDLRIGAAAFRRADYEEAMLRFKSAAELAPDDAAPLMALAQAELALGRDAQAARDIRRAVRLRPEMLRTSRAIASAYGEGVEFDRVMEALETRAAAVPGNADSKFVLAVQRFFTGDARCRETFTWLQKAVPDDDVAALFVEACLERFGTRRTPDEAGKDPARDAQDES